jgi:hypothetical protein
MYIQNIANKRLYNKFSWKKYFFEKKIMIENKFVIKRENQAVKHFVHVLSPYCDTFVGAFPFRFLLGLGYPRCPAPPTPLLLLLLLLLFPASSLICPEMLLHYDRSGKCMLLALAEQSLRRMTDDCFEHWEGPSVHITM